MKRNREQDVLNRVRRACAKLKSLQGEGFTPSEAARRASHEHFCCVTAERGHELTINAMPGYVAFEIEAVATYEGELHRARVTYYLPARNFKREIWQ